MSTFEQFFSLFKVIDLEKMIRADELMDLHRIERLMLGKQGLNCLQEQK